MFWYFLATKDNRVILLFIIIIVTIQLLFILLFKETAWIITVSFMEHPNWYCFHSIQLQLYSTFPRQGSAFSSFCLIRWVIRASFVFSFLFSPPNVLRQYHILKQWIAFKCFHVHYFHLPLFSRVERLFASLVIPQNSYCHLKGLIHSCW